MINLKETYGDRYRIILDEASRIPGQSTSDRMWLQLIPCNHGHIYVHGEDKLGAYSNNRKSIRRLISLPGVQLHQRGDSEVTVVFSPDVFPEVADLLKAKKRKGPKPLVRRAFDGLESTHGI